MLDKIGDGVTQHRPELSGSSFVQVKRTKKTRQLIEFGLQSTALASHARTSD